MSPILRNTLFTLIGIILIATLSIGFFLMQKKMLEVPPSLLEAPGVSPREEMDHVGIRKIDETCSGSELVVLCATISADVRPSSIVIDDDHYLYVANYDDGFVDVYDIAIAKQPKKLSSTHIAYPLKIAVQNKHLYVISYDAPDPTLNIFDVRNPKMPTELGTVALAQGPHGLAVNEPYVYIGSTEFGTSEGNPQSGQLQVIDVTDFHHPVRKAGLSTRLPIAIHRNGNYLYAVTERDQKWKVFDVLELDPRDVATLTIGNSMDFSINGKYAYVPEYFPENQLRVIDLTRPLAPTEATTMPLSARMVGPVSTDYYFSLTNTDKGETQLYTLENPLSPSLLTVIPTGSSEGIAMKGDFAFVPMPKEQVITINKFNNPTGFHGY